MYRLVVGSGAGYTWGMFSGRWKNVVPLIGFVLALTMRLWHLGTPPQIVSDEVSFVNDGWSYVTHQNYFDPHPPLGKLEIGLVMKFFGYHPVAWRMVDVVGGALIIPLLWWVTWRLTKRRVAANIAALLALLDGLMLVDSRLGLINIPYVLASLAAFACLLKAFDTSRAGRWLWFAGTLLGMALATKWLAVLVGIPMLILWAWPHVFGQKLQSRSQHDWVAGCFSLVIWPMVVYGLVFVIHYSWLGTPSTFFSTNLQMLNYHLSVPSIGDPNRQPWWGWLLAWRPFPYWTDVSSGRVSLIRSLPNPFIWWSGALLFLSSLVQGWRDGLGRLLNTLLLFAWIPFVFIHRIMYSYHALLFDVWLIVFVSVALGKLWDRHRRLVLTYLTLTLAVFIWFAPWYLNIPLSPHQQKLRQWLPGWGVQL